MTTWPQPHRLAERFRHPTAAFPHAIRAQRFSLWAHGLQAQAQPEGLVPTQRRPLRDHARPAATQHPAPSSALALRAVDLRPRSGIGVGAER